MITRLLQSSLVIVLLASCGPRDPGAGALESLASAGYSLSVADFHRAAASGDTRALGLFLQCGTLVDVPAIEGSQSVTALRVAVRHGQDAAALFLLDHGASLQKADSDPASPLLQLAVRSGKEPLLRSLLARPDLPSTPLEPLLLLASTQGEVGLIEALLDYQPSLPLDACLFHAASRGHLGLTDFLLQHQANPNAIDPASAQTALMRASSGGHLPVIELLLTAGASRFFGDKEGLLAADHARIGGHPHIAARLWQPLSRFEQEPGFLSDPSGSPPPDGWSSATAPAIPLHPPVALNPGQPRPLSPLRHAIVGHHSGLVTPPPSRQRLELHSVRPSQLPFHLLSIALEVASIEQLSPPPGRLRLTAGDPVGQSGWTLASFRSGPGDHLPDWLPALALVKHTVSGSHLALLPSAPARFGPLCAVIHISGSDEFYEGHPGDLFRFTNTPDAFKLLSIQPRRVQVQDPSGTFWITLKPAF